jgi:hypothetical protein
MGSKERRKVELAALAAFVDKQAQAHPGCSKDAVAQAVAERFHLDVKRSVYFGADFAVRFSSAAGQSFSNTVLSLSALRDYDHLPVVVCVVRPAGIQLLLANSTLIDKLSHSSQRLSHDKVRGSFNGTDILRNFDGLENVPQNFDALFDRHLQVGFEENYERIVENTLAIRGRGAKFVPTPEEQRRILSVADLAHRLSHDPDYIDLRTRLARAVEEKRGSILAAATSTNVNLRGNAIEQIVTRAGNLHKTEDLAATFASGVTVCLNIKSKLIGYSSCPAAYNIDKLLRLLSHGNTVFAFLFIGMDVPAGTVSTQMVSFLDTTILAATRVQPHWAGRNSRGGTQLSEISSIFAPRFREAIDAAKARLFLERLLSM